MGRPAHKHEIDDIIPLASRLPRARAEPRPQYSRTIGAQLVTTPVAGERILDSLVGGANEYIMASPDGRLSVRVRLELSPSQSGSEVFGNGALTVDWSKLSIEHGDNRVSLTQTEIRLLSGLLAANGQIVPRRVLIEAAWPRSDPASRENSLAVYICALRKRLASIGLGEALQTVRRVGYRIRL